MENFLKYNIEGSLSHHDDALCIEWEPCFDDFKSKIQGLGKWKSLCDSRIRSSEVVSAGEIGDKNTDPSVGWETCRTLKGLREHNMIPDVDDLTDGEVVELMDILLLRLVALIDGRGVTSGPFMCVYLHDIDGLLRKNKEKPPHPLAAYCDAICAISSISIAAFGAISVLELEEGVQSCLEVMNILKNANIETVDKKLAESISIASSSKNKKEIILRLKLLKDFRTMLENIASPYGSKESIMAINLAGKLKKFILDELIPSRELRGNTSLSDERYSAIFPKDIVYWFSISAILRVHCKTPVVAMTLLADLCGKLSNLSTFSSCKNLYDIVTVCDTLNTTEKICGEHDPLVIFRPISAIFVLGCNPIETLLGGLGIRDRILVYLDEEMGAPLYRSILSTTSAKKSTLNRDVIDVARYYTYRNPDYSKSINGVNGSNDDVVKKLAMDISHQLQQWLIEVSNCFMDFIVASLCQRGRFHRRLGNLIPLLGRIYMATYQMEMSVFSCGSPCPQSEMSTNGAVYCRLAAVLSAFVTEFQCEAMERYVSLTSELDLNTPAERSAMNYHLQVIVNVRVESVLARRLSPEILLILQRRLNKHANIPTATPALTTRRPGNPDQFQAVRVDSTRLLYDVIYVATSALHHHGLISNAHFPDSALTTLGEMFDNRFQCFAAIKFPSLGAYETFLDRSSKMGKNSIFNLFCSTLRILSGVTETIKTNRSDALAVGSPMATVLLNLLKAAISFHANITLIQGALFGDEVEKMKRDMIACDNQEGREKLLDNPAVNLSGEELRSNLAKSNHIVLLEPVREYPSIFVPVFTKIPNGGNNNK